MPIFLELLQVRAGLKKRTFAIVGAVFHSGVDALHVAQPTPLKT